MKATLLIHREEILHEGRYFMIVKVYEVEKSKKFPAGIKAKFVLQNTGGDFARLLIDNHHPYGFHMHTKLPHDHSHRELLDVKDHMEVLNFFLKEVGRIIRNEKT